MTKYKADMRIKLSLSIGFVCADHENEETLEELTGLTEEDLADMEDQEVEIHLDEALDNWANNYIERNWTVVE